jgi:hypothetical protein
MPTRGEQFRYDQERKKKKGGAKPASKQSHKKGEEVRSASGHVGKKATYADEELKLTNGARPSRKSSRKSANRSKSDSNLNLREEMQKGSPESTFRKSRARTSRVRGGGAVAG